jgi:hypothetical protein
MISASNYVALSSIGLQNKCQLCINLHHASNIRNQMCIFNYETLADSCACNAKREALKPSITWSQKSSEIYYILLPIALPASEISRVFWHMIHQDCVSCISSSRQRWTFSIRIWFLTFGNSVGKFVQCRQWFRCDSCYFGKCLFFSLISFSFVWKNLNVFPTHTVSRRLCNLFRSILSAANIFIKSKYCGVSSPSASISVIQKYIFCIEFSVFNYVHRLYSNQLHYLHLSSCNHS